MADDSPAAASSDDVLDRRGVEEALEVAVRAPSIHNTQPWRWDLDARGLVLLADRDRQLTVGDPDGHSLLVSCGAALALTELALRAEGWLIQTTRLPDPAHPDALALMRPVGRRDPDEEVRDRVGAALLRHSDRRPFSTRQVSDGTMETLRGAGSSPHVNVHFPIQAGQGIDLAAAVSWADRVERDDRAYTEEVNRWIDDPDVRPTSDGVPIDAVPHISPGHPRHTNIPLRDFEIGVNGHQLITQDVDEHPRIAVIMTRSDTALDHLRAGEAMMSLMVRAQLLGLASCPLSQAVDFAEFRTRLQGLMGWVAYPQMMVRLGYPSQHDENPPRTPRRPVADVLHVRTA
jgi:hypothetical protein